MKTILRLLAILASIPYTAMAADIPNPAQGYFIDLRNFGYDNSFGGLMTYIINIVIAASGLIAVGFIIYGGFQYITSSGDEERSTAGKKTLTNAIIGLVIVILSYTIVTVIANALDNKV